MLREAEICEKALRLFPQFTIAAERTSVAGGASWTTGKTLFRFSVPGALLLMLALVAQEGATSQIFHRSLEQVLTSETPVVFARLETVRFVHLAGSLEVHLTVGQVEVVQLRGPSQAELVYSQSTNFERVLSGRVHRVSPIFDGSGLETRMVIGERYYILLNTSGSRVVRVEPESSGAQIRRKT